MIPASSGDQAMKVILFLCVCQFTARYLMVPGKCLPGALAGREVVLDVIDGISGSLAHGTLQANG